MDRELANQLCEQAGVSEVPFGVDPQDWLDDNDVFDTDIFRDDRARAQVVAEVLGPRIKKETEDRKRIGSLLVEIKKTHVRVQSLPKQVEWTQLDKGLWDAFGGAPNDVYTGQIDGQIVFKHEYGNAVGYFVPSGLVDSCTKAWFENYVLRFYVDNPQGHVYELARYEFFGGVLGGRDAIRAIDLGLVERLETTFWRSELHDANGSVRGGSSTDRDTAIANAKSSLRMTRIKTTAKVVEYAVSGSQIQPTGNVIVVGETEGR